VLIIAVFVIGLCGLRLAGADLSRLNDLRVRWWPLALGALVTQVAIISLWPDGWRAGHLAVNLATYAAIGGFLYANRRIRRLWILALGTACNTLAIVVNGGVMPASAAAMAASHRSGRAGFANSAPVVHARLQFLGDIIATPSWLPLHNVASIGDVLIVGGALLVVGHQAWRRVEMAPT
jgi:hypothetical protein